MNCPAILIVEDEPAIAESLEYVLQRAGFDTLLASTLAKAEHLSGRPALILLDLMLPDGSGFDFIRRLRQAADTTPVIVLSSRGEEKDRVAALEQGADDYVTKPFSPREIVARVRAVLRRHSVAPTGPSNSTFPAFGLKLDRDSRQATVNGLALELTRVEFDLLAQLLDDSGRVYSRSELIDRVWGHDFAITDRTVDSHIKSLRKKIGGTAGSSPSIQTVRGVGFRINSSPSTDKDGTP